MIEAICIGAVFLLLCIGILIVLPSDTEKKNRSEKIRSYQSVGKLKLAAERWKNRKSTLLTSSKIPRILYLCLVIVCAIAGYIIGRVIFSSQIISVALGIVCMFLPIAWLSYRKTQLHNAWLRKLNSSMMVLSNSYVVTKDFITSVETNLEMLDYPDPFRNFLVYVKYVDSDIASGLRRIENQVSNQYFSQWIDALALAQKDRSLCYVTVAIVESMRDVLTVQQEADAAMFQVWRDYLIVLALIFATPLIFRIMMADAYVVLTTTFAGQALMFLLLACIVLSVVLALRINRPQM